MEREVKKVKYIGNYPMVVEALIKDKVYDIMSIERGWYRIMTEFDEDYLFPPECFEIVEYENVK